MAPSDTNSDDSQRREFWSRNDSHPVVSVIIVSWNARDYLSNCLTSLTAEVCAYPMEIIVVDNASSDGSGEMVERSFPRARVLRNATNLGFAKANNIGILQARGKYLCLINSDVKVLPGCITKLVDYMEAHRKVGLAGPRMLGPDGTVGRSARGFPTVWNLLCHALALDSILPKLRLFSGYSLRYRDQTTTGPVDILGGWFWIVRRRALDEVGLLDENFYFYAEDMDWCKRFRLRGFGVVYCAEAASIHFGGGSSQNAPIKNWIQEQRADRQYWRKYHSQLGQAAHFCICILHQTTRLVGHGLLLSFLPRCGVLRSKLQRSWHSLLWLVKRDA